ncbi:lipid II flippase MurJ [Streptomyces sp. B1I3]|uniref:lipid II flippase MurJ n=1 Tax=Streptomyces sp. B1I3 TaxID=3042264 RepID=UPI002784F14A|nr:lipid II flippase MurJ [Streptomyces sp. B1I3]MDQ0792102.1 putative peptidoglycan lipid II flippase [Streptomyces sp. B1I3]
MSDTATEAAEKAPVPGARDAPVRPGRFLARAAAGAAGLTVVAAVLGLVRDQAVARLFGASHASDAFLIAWTVPEMAATLLIEDGMALLLVPAFSHALTRRAAAGHMEDPVRALVAGTLPRLAAALACAGALLAAGAPWAVGVLAPGLEDPALAVDCTRLTAVTVFTFGVTGYFSAALRAHGRFLAPAGVYIAYNIGIIGTTLALHSLWGVRAAAAGVAVGSVLMILTQLPTFVRLVLRGGTWVPRRRAERQGVTALLGATVLAPVVLFVVSRQSQVLVERFLASSLSEGAISHLNYAQKVAQLPMVLAMMICTVTFPVVARAMAAGDLEGARRRVERDLALAGTIVLLGTAMVFGYAPHIVEILFQRGAFDAADTAATAGVMRVYALGLLGHTLVGALCRPYFSAGRPTWFPLCAMATGLLVTTGAGLFLTGPLGVEGIAAANALGISTTAALMLLGLGSHAVAVRAGAVALSLCRPAAAAAVAGLAGCLTASSVPGPVLGLAAGCLLVPSAFLLTCLALRAPEAVHLLALIRQRFPHGR